MNLHVTYAQGLGLLLCSPFALLFVICTGGLWHEMLAVAGVVVVLVAFICGLNLLGAL